MWQSRSKAVATHLPCVTIFLELCHHCDCLRCFMTIFVYSVVLPEVCYISSPEKVFLSSSNAQIINHCRESVICDIKTQKIIV